LQIAHEPTLPYSRRDWEPENDCIQARAELVGAMLVDAARGPVMLENRPRLRNHLFATAILFGAAIGGASALDFMLTSGFQLGTAQATERTSYAGDPVYVVNPQGSAYVPSSFSGDTFGGTFQEVGYDMPVEDLDGGANATRTASAEGENELYREIAALYEDEPLPAEEEVAVEEDGYDPVYDALAEQTEQIKAQVSGNVQSW